MEGETIFIQISVSQKEESDLIVDLLKGSGWEVNYQCTESVKPEYISTSLVRKPKSKNTIR